MASGPRLIFEFLGPASDTSPTTAFHVQRYSYLANCRSRPTRPARTVRPRLPFCACSAPFPSIHRLNRLTLATCPPPQLSERSGCGWEVASLSSYCTFCPAGTIGRACLVYYAHMWLCCHLTAHEALPQRSKHPLIVHSCCADKLTIMPVHGTTAFRYFCHRLSAFSFSMQCFQMERRQISHTSTLD